MKAKTTRRTLLLSAMALLLCCTMLVGTTFAWFTDSISSGVNMIASGNLDVDMKYGKVANGQISGWNDVAGAENLFDPNALWEPGRVEVVYLQVNNLGTLQLNYQLNVKVNEETPAKNVDDTEFKLSDHLVFKVVEMDDSLTTYTDRQAVAAAAGTALGLKDYNGQTTKLEPNGIDYVALIVYMPESVGNEANYRGTEIPTIKLGVELAATQVDVESDSFGPDYDEFAGLPWDGTTKEEPEADENGIIHITNSAELVALMDVTGNSIYYGKTIVLDADINLGGRTVKGIGSDGTNFAGIFDGQGHTISNFKIDASGRGYYAGLFNQVSHGGTVKNLTVANATVTGTSMVGAVASSVDSGIVTNCKAINCTVSGVKKVGSVIGYSAGGTVTDNYAENCIVYYSEKDGSEILGFENTGSTVSGNTFSNVTALKAQTVSTAAQLAAAIPYGGNIVLGADIDTGNNWTSARSTDTLTILGNGHTITNLNKPLLVGNAASHVTIKDLTITKSNVGAAVNENGLGTGAFIAFKDAGGTVTFENCHLVDSTVTGNERAGGLIGYSSGTHLTIRNCSVTNCKITAYGGAAGLAGYVQSALVVENSKVTGTTVTANEDRLGTKSALAGAVIGTVNGNTVFTNVTASGNTVSNNNALPVYSDSIGRWVSGTLTIDGTAMTK